MLFKMVKKKFMLVGLKGSGEFEHFGSEVPMVAKEFLSRAHEILHLINTEIALFEPKRGEHHKVGHYLVGMLVSERLNEVPIGMSYMETNNRYITTRGNISEVGHLHMDLLNWAEEKGYQRDLDAYIIETYHPSESGEEEVQIYVPIDDKTY